jgi:hypothetical protein
MSIELDAFGATTSSSSSTTPTSTISTEYERQMKELAKGVAAGNTSPNILIRFQHLIWVQIHV